MSEADRRDRATTRNEIAGDGRHSTQIGTISGPVTITQGAASRLRPVLAAAAAAAALVLLWSDAPVVAPPPAPAPVAPAPAPPPVAPESRGRARRAARMSARSWLFTDADARCASVSLSHDSAAFAANTAASSTRSAKSARPRTRAGITAPDDSLVPINKPLLMRGAAFIGCAAAAP